MILPLTLWTDHFFSRGSNISPTVKLYLMLSNEETVDVISGGVWVKGLLVFLDLFHNKLSQLFDSGKDLVMSSRQPLHKPREDVIRLKTRPTAACQNLTHGRFGGTLLARPAVTCPQGLLKNLSSSERVCRRRRKWSSSYLKRCPNTRQQITLDTAQLMKYVGSKAAAG